MKGIVNSWIFVPWKWLAGLRREIIVTNEISREEIEFELK
jgi:hypothetical protein